ncbi:Exo1p [Saccharomyces cerevisiae x Saccharomyces kudriavzevii VIN7]|uniref:Exo1p n=1 Tax=Saccharomyces cerevisiae x Saccharomyces kudriavzevii (strain VIN7) TaxID=1095631 RepID=H0H111_SACCK|nr:Exo1p [Saccharomyces cerevisiae x Saccharomyces kudriavzevii VIN7]
MGIQGLLPQLKSIQNPVSLRRYEGEVLAIDGYAWLHRAACSCAYELAMGKPTDKYLQFFIKRLSLLKTFKVEPYLVFDGDAIPVKKSTEFKRRDKRQENKAIAERLWACGERKNAMDYFQKCVDITPDMAKCIICYCKLNGIRYIVAPFEADSQMVYLEQKNIVQGIISEDSDLLVFGCQRLITKLNDYGECLEICRDNFNKLPKKFPLGLLTDEEIRTMVCLSGCDYTNGIPKVGLITAMKLVRRFNTMERILLRIQREGKFAIPDAYIDEYEAAVYAFQFQRVFCPIQKRIVSLNEIPLHLRDTESKRKKLYECIGHVIHRETQKRQIVHFDNDIDHHLHFKIAQGDLNPYDFHQPLANREHKLQLVSKSNLEFGNSNINCTGVKNKPIESFFHKVQGGDHASKVGTNVHKIRQLEDKLTMTIKRRKLSNVDAVQEALQGTRSKFFNKTSMTIIEDFNEENISQNHTEEANAQPPMGSISESQLSTQIPSSFIKNNLEVDDNPSEEVSEVVSDVEEHRRIKECLDKETMGDEVHSTDDDDDDTTEDYSETAEQRTPTSSTSSLPGSSQRSISGCTKVLQRFKYSSSFTGVSDGRQPLFPRNVNQKSKGIVYVNQNRDHDYESEDDKAQVVQRPSLRKTLIGNRSQRIIVGMKSADEKKPYNSSPILHEESEKRDVGVTKQNQTRPAVRSISLLSQFVYKGK